MTSSTSPKQEHEELRQVQNRKSDDEEAAVDDSEDLDEEYVHMQQSINNDRRHQAKSLVQEVLPFLFSPLIRPLTIRDADCCTALEAAAFADPAHRCSRDKVSRCPSTCPSTRFVMCIPSDALPFQYICGDKYWREAGQAPHSKL